MQHGPCCLVSTQTQDTLQPKRTHTVFLIRYIPCRSEPAAHRSARFLENRSCCHATLLPTNSTNQSLAAGPKRFARLAASRADKFSGPTQLFKKLQAGLLVVKPVEKLAPVTRVVLTCNRIGRKRAHHYILTQVELIGYPIYGYRSRAGRCSGESAGRPCWRRQTEFAIQACRPQRCDAEGPKTNGCDT